MVLDRTTFRPVCLRLRTTGVKNTSSSLSAAAGCCCGGIRSPDGGPVEVTLSRSARFGLVGPRLATCSATWGARWIATATAALASLRDATGADTTLSRTARLLAVSTAAVRSSATSGCSEVQCVVTTFRGYLLSAGGS